VYCTIIAYATILSVKYTDGVSETPFPDEISTTLSASPPEATTRWLTPLEMACWRGFVETYSDLVTALEADLVPTGLTLGDYQVLVYLSEAVDHSMRMCDLATMLQLSPSGLTRRLDGLVSAGFVARRGSEADRRVMLAQLTPTGMARLEAAAPTHVESVRQHMIDLLDEHELAAMGGAFEKVRQHLAGNGSVPLARRAAASA
jgi:DNA-binding MarR family transcriptional regulator